MVNRIITAREEEELSKYVAQRLSRTRPSSNKSPVHPPRQSMSIFDPLADWDNWDIFLTCCRSGQAFVRDPEQGARLVPDIVQVPPAPAAPPAPPSAMKGAGGHPPRSPKDKVTFAEFTEIAEHKEEEESDIVKTEFCASLDVPVEFNGKVIILEPLEDTKSSDRSQEEETDRLLSHNTPD